MRRDTPESPRIVLSLDDAPRAEGLPSSADAAPSAAVTGEHGDDFEGGDVLDQVAMLQEPRHLDGQRREQFSPDQFYAVSRVVRTDVDGFDDGLWLTEEPCPKITSDGVQFHATVYFHPSLDVLVDVGAAAPQRNFVVRYNRAHLARGVLKEIVILEKDALGGYVERCRCHPKDEFTQIDFNRLIAQRERLKKVLLAKVAHAQGMRITLEHGDRALEELRNEQARQVRLQRKARRVPIAAAPIMANSQREDAHRADSQKIAELSARLQANTAPARADRTHDVGEGSLASVPSSPPQAASRKPRRAAQAKAAPKSLEPRLRGEAAGEGMEQPGPSSMVDDGPARPRSATSLAEYLGTRTGIVTEDDD